MLTLHVRSNVKQTIERLQKWRSALPAAVRRPMADLSQWEILAKNAADSTLLGLAGPDERGFVPLFVQTVVALMFGSGFELRMTNPVTDRMIAPDLVSQAVGIKERLQLRRRGSRVQVRKVPLASLPFEDRILDRVSQAISDWVQEPFTSEDDPASGKDMPAADKSDPEAIHRDIQAVRAILFDPRPTPAMLAARQGLASRIGAFMVMQQIDAGNLSPITLNTWMRAVLLTWRNLVRRELPRAVQREIRKELRK